MEDFGEQVRCLGEARKEPQMVAVGRGQGIYVIRIVYLEGSAMLNNSYSLIDNVLLSPMLHRRRVDSCQYPHLV